MGNPGYLIDIMIATVATTSSTLAPRDKSATG